MYEPVSLFLVAPYFLFVIFWEMVKEEGGEDLLGYLD